MANLSSLGLRVEKIVPEAHTTNADVNSDIKIYFNLELSANNIIGNVSILKDTNLTFYEGFDKSKCTKVEGTFTYKDMCIIFIPSSQLEAQCRYVVSVDKNITDAHGNNMLSSYAKPFDTEGVATLKPCSIINPVDNSVVKDIAFIELEDLKSEKYLIQVSKQKTFEINVIDKFTETNVLENLSLADGLYYIRAKAANGLFGDVSVVTVRREGLTAPTEEDLDEDYVFLPTDAEEGIDVIDLVEQFPECGSINTSNKLNALYWKFSGKVEEGDIDIYETGVYGVLSSDDDTDLIQEHGYLKTTCSVIYDEEEDITYVILIPEILSGGEDD